MTSLPCIICENGDPYSHILCESCEIDIEHRKDTHEAMIELVMKSNNLNGCISYELLTEIKEKVRPIYDELCQIRIQNEDKKDES